MDKEKSASILKHQWGWSIAAISLCMLIAGWGSQENYSYWQDELVSAAAIKANWSELYRIWIIPDTAPPLYATLLKAWSWIWGEQERTLRALSLACTLLSLIITAWARHNSSTVRAVITILFLGLSPTLVGHAQEARNYALTLLLSTLLTASYTSDNPRKPTKLQQTAAALLLSLTHYFGLIFAIAATGAKATRQQSKRSLEWCFFTIAIMLPWPIYHLIIASRPESNLARVEWIKVQPVIGTLQEFLAGTLPIIGIGAALAMGTCFTVSLANASWRSKLIRIYRLCEKDHPKTFDESILLTRILAFFLALAIAADLIHPVSTARNYIVALPATAFLFGNLSEMLLRRSRIWLSRCMACVAAMILTALLLQSIEDNRKFTQPMMNYKAVAEIIKETRACDAGCYATRTYERLSVYFDLGQLKSYAGAKQTKPNLLLGLGTNPEKFRKTIKDFPELECWAPVQSVHPGVFVMVKDPGQLPLQEYSFTPCKRV